MLTRVRLGIVLFFLFYCVITPAQTIHEILDRADKLYRSKSSYALVEMKIKNINWERTLEMEMWTKGMKNTFISILKPKKDSGISTLRKDKMMWNYFPKINKVVKVPPSMMMGSWMGSDFTNDDLVKESTFVKDYNSKFLASGDPNLYFIELIPKKDSVSIWGKITLKIDRKHLLLIEQKNFDERGDLARTLSFTEVQNMGGKRLPTVMTLTSHKKKNNQTIVRYKKAKFDQLVSNKIFTRKNLQKNR